MRGECSKMAETEELKQMVLSFRRAELVELLGFVGMNKVGVKATLLQRGMTLVNSARGCSLPVQIKIRELYRQIHNPFSSEPPRARTAASVRTQQSEPDPRTRRYASNKAVSGSQLVGGGLSSSQCLQNPAGAVDYTKRAAESLSTGSTALPVHPDVSFKRLPFYDVMGELLKPTSLGKTKVPKGPSRYQETYFIFHLTPQQAQDIAMSRDFRPSAKIEYTVQVQLRFCFLETSCEQDDNFPPSICVRVNGKVAPLPNPIPTTKPGVEPKRPGRPVDITSLCRISPTMPNHVEISWASEYGRCYCVSINLVKRLSSDVLLTRLKQFGNRHADHTRALIKDKLRQDPDCEIATTSLRVSLMCPLGKMRMQLPCRANTCTHLQCFDATTFFLMNEKKATWMCPVCDKPTPFHKLVIDGLFVEILRKVSDVDEIQFVEDGSWSPIRNNRETHFLGSPAVSKSSRATDQTVNLCGDSDSTSSPAKKPKMDVIDLTLSDSDDDNDDDDMSEAPARPQSSQEISSGSSTPSLIINSSVLSPKSPMLSVPSPVISPPPDTKVNLQPLPALPAIPPLYRGASSSPSKAPASVSRSNSNSSNSGLNLSVSGTTNGYGPYSSSNSSSLTYSPSETSMASTPSWLTALSGQSQGQKRPPPAHTNTLPPSKRQYMEKLSDSPSSSNSNMSPLVDLDQLCSILDSDRDRNNEEIASVLAFPSDFPMPMSTSAHSSATGSSTRTIFNPSPTDVISLD